MNVNVKVCIECPICLSVSIVALGFLLMYKKNTFKLFNVYERVVWEDFGDLEIRDLEI